NHNEVTAQKFLPTFTYEELEQAGLQAIRNGALLETPEQFRKELAELKQALFDPSFEPLTTAKNPRGGLDIIQASANNFYAGVTLADLKDFKEQYPLDSRVVKVNNRLVEQVYRAGRPDGSVPAGLYANYLDTRQPWAEKYKKQSFKPPLAKAVETVTETGDYGVSTVGDNLPNEDEIHEKYGTKSFFFTGSSRTLHRAAGFTSREEFA